MKLLLTYFKLHNLLFTALIMGTATAISFLFFLAFPEDTINIALIYILALALIARWTDGYRYGLCSACLSVLCINFIFTYPYFRLNFTLSGYPVTFIAMLMISFLTSAATSHLKQQSKILAENEKQLAEADKEKMRANLLRAVSHDLRTPLTSIIGAASSYMDNSCSFTEQEKNALVHNIYDDANWLLNMVENLLSVTRIQNDCQKVSTSPEVVDEVVAESVHRLKKRNPHAEVTVLTPDEFLMIPMDAMLIEQVIINLLENAFRHAPSSTPPLLKVESLADHVIFRIFDYGPGMEESRLHTIFEGSGESPASSDGTRGMGIGLSICKTIIDAHNGTISARNHEHGAEFYFTLPKEESHEP